MNSVSPLLVALPIAAYFIGNLSPGLLLTRALGRGDVRTQGSGGTGATNAARVLGGGGFAAVLALDMAKGAFAALLPVIAAALMPEILGSANSSRLFTLVLACGLSAVAGHVWPALLNFRGGKGIGPFLGVWCGAGFVAWPEFWFAPLTLFVAILGGALLLPLGRGAFLSALCALPLQPVCLCLLIGTWKPFPPAFAMILVLLYAHRENFRRRSKQEQSATSDTLSNK